MTKGPICPKDMGGCVDDVCRGSGCVQMRGEPMLYVCTKCTEFADHYFECDCDEYPYDDVDLSNYTHPSD